MATLTVSDTNPRVQYTATSSQTVFAYGFPIFEDADLKVYQDTTLLTLTTDYTVSGAASSSGGNVTLGTGATSGDIITIYRDLAVARSSDYQTGGDLLAETLNDDLDKLVMMVQQSEFDVSNRSIRFGQFVTGLPLNEITDNATDRADKVITFDSSGQPQATLEIGTNQGDWATSTSYVARDIIKDTSNNNIYLCNEAHTSSGSQPISGNTDSAKWDLLVDASSATTSQAAAATSATAAATSATSSASSATSSASSATSSASSATTATTQASAASTSATAAATSATSAAASFDSFDDVYLGEKSSAPTLDNDSDALQAGALYFNSSTNALNVYSGSSWSAIAADTDVKVLVSSNDTTAGYLNGKLVAGTAVSFTENNDGSNETLTIASTALPLAGGTMSGETIFADQLATRPVMKDYGETVNAIGAIGGGTQDIDLTLGNVVTGTVDTSTTTFTFSNSTASDELCGFTLTLTNGGSQTVNWPGAVDWAGGSAPSLTSSGIDIITFTTIDAGTIWYGFAAGLDMG